MAFQELGCMQLWFMEAVFGIYANSKSTENKESSVRKETCREKLTESTAHRTVLPMMKNPYVSANGSDSDAVCPLCHECFSGMREVKSE
jgi:hypothetical protein